MKQGQSTLIRAERMKAPPEVVFDFLIDPDKLLRWFGTAVEIDPKPGGTFWLSLDGSDNAAGTYLEVDRPRRVIFTWGWEGSTAVPPESSTVSITLIGAGDETIVELRHEGLPATEFEDHGDGWHHLLERLALVVSGQDAPSEGPT